MNATNSNHAIFGRKVALLIGNLNYCENDGQLYHTIDEINDVLRTINFHVEKHHDLCNSETINIFPEFSKTILDGDLVLFYFSGHGCEMDRKNYLLPIDDEFIEKKEEIENCVVHSEQILHRWLQ
ncbi:unnamed protein product [Adineta ricciae]|uniref:Peptidase C14 caspase domain-containing protein n=1 Tax=Adineta ricciae TaxID=249248 RepID=A0A816G6Q0_ADIRI|nr:unnamed protein product [Adineta ricciae]CAF1669911.1 unnamed protein product [Adineta ricciae]